MKIKVLTFALVLMSLTANAQQKAKTFSITPKAGVTASSFSGKMPATISYVIVPVDGGIDELRPVDESKLIRVGARTRTFRWFV